MIRRITSVCLAVMSIAIIGGWIFGIVSLSAGEPMDVMKGVVAVAGGPEGVVAVAGGPKGIVFASEVWKEIRFEWELNADYDYLLDYPIPGNDDAIREYPIPGIRDANAGVGYLYPKAHFDRFTEADEWGSVPGASAGYNFWELAGRAK